MLTKRFGFWALAIGYLLRELVIARQITWAVLDYWNNTFYFDSHFGGLPILWSALLAPVGVLLLIDLTNAAWCVAVGTFQEVVSFIRYLPDCEPNRRLIAALGVTMIILKEMFFAFGETNRAAWQITALMMAMLLSVFVLMMGIARASKNKQERTTARIRKGD